MEYQKLKPVAILICIVFALGNIFYLIDTSNVSLKIENLQYSGRNGSTTGRNRSTDILYEKVKILAFAFTQPANLPTKATAIKKTWGKRVNKMLFANDEYDPKFPTIPMKVPHGRGFLTLKIKKALDYVYKTYKDKYDWYMKTDDDSFFFVENLRKLLSKYDPNKPYFLGQFMQAWIKKGYYLGCAMILSREALNMYGKYHETKCSMKGTNDDIDLALCLQGLGMNMTQIYDSKGKPVFQPTQLENVIKGEYPGWFVKYDISKGKLKGIENMSKYAVSFHYVTPIEMYKMEFLTHYLKLNGIQREDD